MHSASYGATAGGEGLILPRRTVTSRKLCGP